jgi:protoporphyrinogen oxidase
VSRVAILGAGMAGLGAARRLGDSGIEVVVYEKNPYPGGHAASHRHGDFIFDEGPHISFTKDERIQRLLAESINGEYEAVQTRVNNYWRGFWIKHPAQINLHGLPVDLVCDVLRDFIEARQKDPGEISNYADWLMASFGETFATTFPMQYGRKFHTTTAENMTTDWLGPRLYRPELEEVLRGALSPETPDVHYVDHFRYPTEGGFAPFLNGLVRDVELELGREVAAIAPADRRLTFADGSEAGYEHLVSSMPLPELIGRIDGAPEEVVEAAGRLACTTCVLVNVGVDREDLSEAHWTYFYDDDYFLTRLSFPHMLSPNNTPPGSGSFQAEVYYSAKYRPLDRDPDECIEPVIRDLRRCGLLRDDDTILHRNAAVVPYANVIFDLDRPGALEAVHGYLDELGIATCGRYGRWGYHWTDESYISGEDAAQELIDRRL